MLSNMIKDNQNDQVVEYESIIPSITTAFIDALSFSTLKHNYTTEHRKIKRHSDPTIKIIPVQSKPEFSQAIKDFEAIIGNPAVAVDPLKVASSGKTASHQDLVRNLIECLSHHFNNVLMGIWGNATLIRLRTGNDTPLAKHLLKMEDLIESWASLINMVLGYLGERRENARRARLDQIVQEIKGQDTSGVCEIKSHVLKKRLQWAAVVQDSHVVAGSTAKVLNVLLQSLSSHRSNLDSNLPSDPMIQVKIDQIDGLILRGQQILHYLLTYAGKRQLRLMPVLLKPVLSGVLTNVVQPFSDTSYLLRRIPDRVTCMMDRAVLSEALRSIMKFMVTLPTHYRGGGAYLNSIPLIEVEQYPDGRPKNLKISVRKANVLDESLSEWRLFEPFRTDPRQNNANGLELSAACEIIKAHNGSVIERIESDKRKCFQFRIPILE